MTTEQFSAMMAELEAHGQTLINIQFLVHVSAFCLCWIAGQAFVKFFIYCKNHRDLW